MGLSNSTGTGKTAGQQTSSTDEGLSSLTFERPEFEEFKRLLLKEVVLPYLKSGERAWSEKSTSLDLINNDLMRSAHWKRLNSQQAQTITNFAEALYDLTHSTTSSGVGFNLMQSVFSFMDKIEQSHPRIFAALYEDLPPMYKCQNISDPDAKRIMCGMLINMVSNPKIKIEERPFRMRFIYS